MKYTENYKFKMPDGNDYVSVDDINDNFDAVDKELAQQKSDFDEHTHTASDVGALPTQMITCTYGNTDEEIIRGLSENWSKLPVGIGSIHFSNGADIWYGNYYKYTETYGSILMQNASGVYTKKFIKSENKLIDLFDETGGTLSGNWFGLADHYYHLYADQYKFDMTTMNNKNDGQNSRVLSLFNSNGYPTLENALVLTDTVNGTTTMHKIYGEHNKPSGSYTGNGSSAHRSISIGGIATVDGAVFIRGGAYNAIVGGAGGFWWDTSGNHGAIPASEAMIENGMLYLNTANSAVNGNGLGHMYNVLV